MGLYHKGDFTMVAIPQKQDPTIVAMKAAIKSRQFNEKPRNYLGASLIGKECARQIWYDYNKYPKEPFGAETLMNFEDGHRTEDMTAERLRMVDGIELWTHNEDGGQFGFSLFDGKFKGHCDGVIRGILQAPKSLHVWECKACAEKQYKAFIAAKDKWGDKMALKEWNHGYFIQAQIYMHELKIDRHYLTVALSGGRDYETCRTEYEKEVALYAIDKAEKIINAEQEPPRINEKPDFFLCKWCSFREICHK